MPARKPAQRVSEKGKVAEAVSTAGRAISALVQSLKDNGEHLSGVEFEQAFVHLHNTMQTLEAQARRDRTLIAASVFSFDDAPLNALNALSAPLKPAPETQTYRYAPPAHTLPPVVFVKPQSVEVLANEDIEDVADFGSSVPKPPSKEEWKKPTGRLSKHSPDPDAGKAVHVEMNSPALKPTDEVDDIANISFSEA